MTEDYKGIRLGGYTGAIIAFALIYLTMIIIYTDHCIKSDWDVFSWTRIFDPLGPALAFSLFGFLAGRVAGRSKNTRHAFVRGGLGFFGLVMIAMIVFSLIALINPKAVGYRFSHSDFLLWVCLLGFFTATGSLLCGLSAIVVRDYRQSRKVRLIPQFTLLELMIVITLSIVVMSFWASFVALCH